MSARLIECADASPEVRAVYDDIMATRQNGLDQQFLEGAGSRSGKPEADLGIDQADYGAGRARSAGERDDLSGRFSEQSVRLLHRVAYRRSPQKRNDAMRCFMN